MNAAELILAQFPGKAYIPFVTAGAAIGIAEQTCYNLHHKGKFPLPVRKQGRLNVVALTDLITYISGQKTDAPTKLTAEPRRRPGRPRNSEQHDQISGS